MLDMAVRHHRLRGLGILTAVLLCGAAACGDDGDGADDGAAADDGAVGDDAAAPGNDAAPGDAAVDGGPVDLALCDRPGVPPATGFLETAPATDVVALCGPRVLVADDGSEALVVLDIATGEELLHVTLPGAPVDLELDADRGAVYVALRDRSMLARVDLVTGELSQIPLPEPAMAVALGPPGRLFASIEGVELYTIDLLYIDTGRAEVVERFAGGDPPGLGFQKFLVYDRNTGRLVSASESSSPSTLERYAFDPERVTLSDRLVRDDVGSNGQSLTISPDGTHVAYACGSGNGSYDIWDFHPEDLESRGEWNTGAYPRAAAFSRDSTVVAATNGYMLQLFSATTHESLGEWMPPLSGCDYDELRAVALSPEADIFFAYANCGFDGDRGQLVWITMPAR
jgi:DNA-binding beta-propeller fold protein YncE